MKKWLFILIGIIVSLLSAVYLFIPNVIALKASKGIASTQSGLHRMLLNDGSVKKWWPGINGTDSGKGYVYNNSTYSFHENNISLLPVIIRNSDISINSSLYLLAIKKDSLLVEWTGAMASSYNPIKRFTAWLTAKQIVSDMKTILAKMESYYSNDETIYGIKVNHALVTDSILISTNQQCKGYPDTKFIYSLIDILENYAALNNATITGYPMLNITTEDSIIFNVRTGLPIDKIVGNSEKVVLKRMLGRGNILVSEVKGGVYTTSKALKEITTYASDHARQSPAIPFFSLITNRREETDSAKWITKIYCPVM